jgi:hypothetical protein
MKRAWLQAFTWAVIVETNRQLCAPKAALHKPTSDGYELARRLWETTHRMAMTLAEATDLCRRCHRLAPFCSFNGNTFVAVIRKVIAALPLTPEPATAVRSMAGHIVAGTATPEEQRDFAAILNRLSGPPAS